MNEEPEESKARLEAAGAAIAVWVEGTQVRAKEVRANAPWPEGAAVWSASEMLSYLSLEPAGRALMRTLKAFR